MRRHYIICENPSHRHAQIDSLRVESPHLAHDLGPVFLERSHLRSAPSTAVASTRPAGVPMSSKSPLAT